MSHEFIETDGYKLLKSDGYNYIFKIETGEFVRWGKTIADDPEYSPYGPEILDIEVTTSCIGYNGKPCTHCYKSNTSAGESMSFDTFKQILDSFSPTLTQIAFGADSHCIGCKDIWKMMDYSRNNGRTHIVPNITVATISDSVADNLAKYCGAVAVSRYAEKDYCYDSVAKLTDRGMNQINIHMLIAEETYDMAIETINDIKTDPRLANMKSMVMLSLKPKGRGNTMHTLSFEKFETLLMMAEDAGISYGMDSCTAPKFLKANKNHPMLNQYLMLAEPCESTLFSSYINVNGLFYPCSFMEGNNCWESGVNVTTVKSFNEEVWMNPRVVEFRNRLINNKNNMGIRECPHYNV